MIRVASLTLTKTDLSPSYRLTRLLCIGPKMPLYSKLPWKRGDSRQVIVSLENAVSKSDWSFADIGVLLSFADLTAASVVLIITVGVVGFLHSVTKGSHRL